MKTFKKIILIFFVIFGFNKQVFSSEIINIGLLVPLSGEYKDIGNSVVNSIRMALDSIDNKRIKILPRDTKSDPTEALKVAKELYTNYGTKIVIGPIFNSSTKFLINLPEVTFLSFTNKLINNKSNVISTGVNAVSQIEAIKKFQEINNLERTFFLVPNNDFKLEIENAISKTKIKLKDKFIYDSDPTKLTAQIEKITRYPQRKQNLIDEIKRLEKSNDPNKEVKIEKLEKKDTLGGINFDSIVIGDFDENLKSVATSLLYTDVSSKRVNYISLNQWFDRSLLEETSLQPIFFPSVNKSNYDSFIKDYKKEFGDTPNQISFLSYDILGLVYYLLLQNNFEIDNKIFTKKNKFKGKIGVFKINKNNITHDLSFYSVENKKFKKIF